jgi:Pyridoxamine 5'-phosphate oxidase
MASWDECEKVAPDLARVVRERFEATGLGFLGTLRRDGAPRISGIEPLFGLGAVWLGMMPNSRKALDLQRDPRLTLHAASVDKQVAAPDARISGRGVEVTDAEVMARYRATFAEDVGQEVPPGPMHLFRVDVSELMTLQPVEDHLLIEWWTEAGGLQRVERR